MTGVQTCALPISRLRFHRRGAEARQGAAQAQGPRRRDAEMALTAGGPAAAAGVARAAPLPGTRRAGETAMAAGPDRPQPAAGRIERRLVALGRREIERVRIMPARAQEIAQRQPGGRGPVACLVELDVLPLDQLLAELDLPR